MALVWNPWALPNLVAGALIMTMAGFVYFVAPERRLNRLLAVVFMLEGLGLVGLGSMYATDSLPDAFGAQMVLAAALAPVPFVYAAFLGQALPGLGPRLLRTRVASVALSAGAISAFAAVVALPEMVVHDPYTPPYAPIEFVPGPLILGILAALGATGLLAIALSANAFLQAKPGSVQRRRARFFLIAFGISDASYLLVFFVIPLGSFSPDSAIYATANVAGVALPMSTTAVLVGYGILRYQLFDVDLKVKWTLRRGTLASVFVATFFVASAVAQQYLERYGVLVGGAAVGLLLFAFRPIEHAADRLADRAMPGVDDTSEYRTVKKREVYRAAVEGALEDDGLSDKERAMLARLAEQLGLGPLEMHDIERDARRARLVA